MKPIIIKVDSMGEIKITEDELKKIVDESYNQGYQDGQKQAFLTQPTIPINPCQNPNYYKVDITC